MHWWLERQDESAAPVLIDRARVEVIVLGVRRCCSYVPKATCLTQALSVGILLRHSGQPSELKIGVRKDDAGGFRAHAWVEVQGKVVIGQLPGLDRFTVLRSNTAIT